VVVLFVTNLRVLCGPLRLFAGNGRTQYSAQSRKGPQSTLSGAQALKTAQYLSKFSSFDMFNNCFARRAARNALNFAESFRADLP
jgi:hypothetical protein